MHLCYSNLMAHRRKNRTTRGYSGGSSARAGLDPSEVTIYALRHSNIVRQLLAGVPARVVAVNHDTSIAMLERTYSRYIGDHADALARRALLDTTVLPNSNVVPIAATRIRLIAADRDCNPTQPVPHRPSAATSCGAPAEAQWHHTSLYRNAKPPLS